MNFEIWQPHSWIPHSNINHDECHVTQYKYGITIDPYQNAM